jgi:hypothetical protein
MAFTKTTVLTTRETALGQRWLGQKIPVPNGRLDKVAVFLEPEITDDAVASAAIVKLSVFALSSGIPFGTALASDTVRLSDLNGRGYHNFRIEADVPTTIAIVLSMSGGDADNFVGWRYVATSSSGEELLISNDQGATWASDSTKKFAYVAFSLLDNVVDHYEQTASVLPGRQASIVDDTNAEFSLAEMDRTMVSGDTVVIKFGDFVFTLVVDQSGSMTWNDHDGLRFDFLKQFIDDIEASLPGSSAATYSIVKFRSRRIGSMSLDVSTGASSAALVSGIRIVRKAGSPPTTPTDGIVVFEGFANERLDSNLTTGTKYYYAGFTFDEAGNFSQSLIDFGQPTVPVTTPTGVAGFDIEEEIVKSGDYDIGKRIFHLSWQNPASFDYDSITLVRRDDRFPQSPVDGTVLLSLAPTSTTSYDDFNVAGFVPANYPINGQTYFYSIFTHKTSGIKCFQTNARQKSVATTIVDRIWEKAEPPANVPPAGFDDAQPAIPTSVAATIGNEEVLLSWLPADSKTRRYRIFYKETKYPQPKNAVNGATDFDGTLIYDGTETSFVHRSLANGEPNFYALVAMDTLNNQSNPSLFSASASETAPDVIEPPQLSSFSVEVVDDTTNRLLIQRSTVKTSSVDVFFGDIVRAIATVSFLDTDSGKISAEFVFVEEADSRKFEYFDEAQKVDETTFIQFANPATLNAESITGVINVVPFLPLQNKVKSASITFHASLRVKNRATGNLIHEVITDPVVITLKHPLDLNIKNDPPQEVDVRTWDPACTLDASPEYDIEQIGGVYARTGDPFLATLEAAFKDAPLSDEILVNLRILEKATGLPSPSVRLPETDESGIAALHVELQSDEIIDRSGQPTGEFSDKTAVDIQIPPQDVPGEYILELSATYRGYTRTSTLEMHFEPSLNIDLDLRAFNPDGNDIQEQKALVYLGSFAAPTDEKIPVADMTVVDWSIKLLGGQGKGKARPFFSRDGVVGTGIKSATHGGVAKNVFFGPGSDVEPARGDVCTFGEMWQISAKAKALGMTAEAFGVVELLPFEPKTLNRIFLRNATTGEIGTDLIFADGETESTWEVVARPESDGTASDPRSGVTFRNGILGLGGTVPSLEEGRVVSLYVKPYIGTSVAENLYIVTNMTDEKGTNRGFAKAKVEGGKATFKIRLNAKVTGKADDPPLDNESSNPIYQHVAWDKSPLVVFLTAYVIFEVNGRPVTFGGGGQSLEGDFPPAFISFMEPLQA